MSTLSTYHRFEGPKFISYKSNVEEPLFAHSWNMQPGTESRRGNRYKVSTLHSTRAVRWHSYCFWSHPLRRLPTTPPAARYCCRSTVLCPLSPSRLSSSLTTPPTASTSVSGYKTTKAGARTLRSYADPRRDLLPPHRIHDVDLSNDVLESVVVAPDI